MSETVYHIDNCRRRIMAVPLMLRRNRVGHHMCKPHCAVLRKAGTAKDKQRKQSRGTPNDRISRLNKTIF